MEEPLIIRRDEHIFKIGFYWSAIAIAVFIVSFIIVTYNQWWPLSYDENRMADIVTEIVGVSFVSSITGILEILDSYKYSFKLEDSGVILRYNSPFFRTERSWGECDCLGVEYSAFPSIVCSRSIGGSVFRITYTPELWDEISTCMARHGVKVMEPQLDEYHRQLHLKYKNRNKNTVCVLRDAEGEFRTGDGEGYRRQHKNFARTMGVVIGIQVLAWYIVLSFIDSSFIKYIWVFPLVIGVVWFGLRRDAAELGAEWIVDRNGMQIVPPFKKKINFYRWSEIKRFGVCSYGAEDAACYIFFTAKHKKIKIRFTEKRYEEFLKYVPEGKETDPVTNEFLIRWRSAMRSYGKGRDDFDEW